jgi:hypothetical protein
MKTCTLSWFLFPWNVMLRDTEFRQYCLSCIDNATNDEVSYFIGISREISDRSRHCFSVALERSLFPTYPPVRWSIVAQRRNKRRRRRQFWLWQSSSAWTKVRENLRTASSYEQLRIIGKTCWKKRLAVLIARQGRWEPEKKYDCSCQESKEGRLIRDKWMIKQALFTQSLRLLRV